MAFLASTAAISSRAPVFLASSFRRRSVLPTAVKATAAASSDSNSISPHPIVSSVRLAASAAVLLAATYPAVACTPSPSPSPPTPPPAALMATVSPDDPIHDDHSHSFEKLIVETAALTRFGGADAARARLSFAAASGGGESCARLLAAQALFVDGKVDEAIAAFEELAREDSGDCRPLFCQGVLYSVLGREAESETMLVRCREVAGDKFDPDFTTVLSPTDAAADAESGAEKVDAEEAEAMKV